MSEWIWIIFFIAMGAAVGSFLNVWATPAATTSNVVYQYMNSPPSAYYMTHYTLDVLGNEDISLNANDIDFTGLEVRYRLSYAIL